MLIRDFVCHLLTCISGNKKYNYIVVQTIDTDVMILAVAYASEYQNMCFNTKVYVFMVNSNKIYDICAIVKFPRRDICRALTFFYAVTGCDIVSSMARENARHGKFGCYTVTIIIN